MAEIKRNYTREIHGKDGQPLYFTKENVTQMYGDFEERKINTWEKLLSTYTKEQVDELGME